MASVHKFPARNNWRVSYYLKLNGKSVKKAKYAKLGAEANFLKTQIERLEAATRTGLAVEADIQEWIERGWIKKEEAGTVFRGYLETAKRNSRATLQETGYQEILSSYEDYAADVGKGGVGRKSYRNHMSLAGQVLEWLGTHHPDLRGLTTHDVSNYLTQLRRNYSDWSVYHYHTKLRLLLDQAIKLGMLSENPARQVKIRQPRKSKERRVLTEEEVKHILDASLNYRTRISGSLPTVVRLGLYAGLRDEEMCWLRWDAIDRKGGIIEIHRSACEETGETWVPKDSEARRLDVKQSFVDYLQEECKRQEDEGMLGPFVMPGGDSRRKGYRKRPLSQAAPQKAFSLMIPRGENRSRNYRLLSQTHIRDDGPPQRRRPYNAPEAAGPFQPQHDDAVSPLHRTRAASNG